MLRVLSKYLPLLPCLSAGLRLHHLLTAKSRSSISLFFCCSPPLHLRSMGETLGPTALPTIRGNLLVGTVQHLISLRGPLTGTSWSCLQPSHQNLRVGSRIIMNKLSGWLLCKLNSEKYCPRDHPPCSTTKGFAGAFTSPPNSPYFSFSSPIFQMTAKQKRLTLPSFN